MAPFMIELEKIKAFDELFLKYGVEECQVVDMARKCKLAEDAEFAKIMEREHARFRADLATQS